MLNPGNAQANVEFTFRITYIRFLKVTIRKRKAVYFHPEESGEYFQAGTIWNPYKGTHLTGVSSFISREMNIR